MIKLKKQMISYFINSLVNIIISFTKIFILYFAYFSRLCVIKLVKIYLINKKSFICKLSTHKWRRLLLVLFTNYFCWSAWCWAAFFAATSFRWSVMLQPFGPQTIAESSLLKFFNGLIGLSLIAIASYSADWSSCSRTWLIALTKIS